MAATLCPIDNKAMSVVEAIGGGDVIYECPTCFARYMSRGILPMVRVAPATAIIFLSKAGVLSVDTNVTLELPVAFRMAVDSIRCNVKGAPLGSAIIVNIRADGVLMCSVGKRPTVPAGQKQGNSTAPDLVTVISVNSVLTLDVDQVGSLDAGSDLIVTIEGRR